MKKSLLGLMLGITFLFGNIQEASAQLTGMKLKALCDSKLESNQIPCLLFIEGVVEGFQMGTFVGSDSDHNAEKKVMCFPKNSNVGQWAAIFKKYLEDHPEDLHLIATTTIILSLRDAFPPCYVDPNRSKALK